MLLLVGLDNAGKTVTVKGLAGENSDNSVPTVGFSTISLNYRDMKITIFDLGGRSDIRGIWPRYFVDVNILQFKCLKLYLLYYFFRLMELFL